MPVQSLIWWLHFAVVCMCGWFWLVSLSQRLFGCVFIHLPALRRLVGKNMYFAYLSHLLYVSPWDRPRDQKFPVVKSLICIDHFSLNMFFFPDCLMSLLVKLTKLSPDWTGHCYALARSCDLPPIAVSCVLFSLFFS